MSNTFRLRTNKQSHHKDLTHNTMYINSPRPPGLRWPCYGKRYGDYQNPQTAAKISSSF